MDILLQPLPIIQFKKKKQPFFLFGVLELPPLLELPAPPPPFLLPLPGAGAASSFPLGFLPPVLPFLSFGGALAADSLSGFCFSCEGIRGNAGGMPPGSVYMEVYICVTHLYLHIGA